MMTVRSISARPVRGSSSCREFVQHLGHLVAAFAAADVDDDVRVAPLGQRLLQHGLAGAEAAGNRGARRRAPPGTGCRGCAGRSPAARRPAVAAPPAAAGAPASGGTVRWSARGPTHRAAMPTRRVGIDFAARGDGLDHAAHSPAAAGTAGHAPSPRPRRTTAPGASVSPTATVGTKTKRCGALIGFDVEAAQQAVVDAAQQARAEPHGHRRAGAEDRVAGLEAGGVFVDLGDEANRRRGG